MPEARFYINPPGWGPLTNGNHSYENLGREQNIAGGGPNSKPKDVPKPDTQTKESQTEERLNKSIVALIVMVRGG